MMMKWFFRVTREEAGNCDKSVTHGMQSLDWQQHEKPPSSQSQLSFHPFLNRWAFYSPHIGRLLWTLVLLVLLCFLGWQTKFIELLFVSSFGREVVSEWDTNNNAIRRRRQSVSQSSRQLVRGGAASGMTSWMWCFCRSHAKNLLILGESSTPLDRRRSQRGSQ